MTTTSNYSEHSWVDVPVGGSAPPGAPDLEASTLNEMEAGIAGAYDFKPGEVFLVVKDPVTGNWPSGWNWRTPIYSGGAPDAFVRPCADPAPNGPQMVLQGPDPSPPVVTSGTEGMYENDMRRITGS